MAGKGIELLKKLKDFAENFDLDYFLPEKITESDSTENLDENEKGDFLRYVKLLKNMEGIAKTSKLIRKCGILNTSEEIKTRADEVIQSSPSTSGFPTEPNESTNLDETPKILKSSPSYLEHPKELDKSIDESESPKSSRDYLQHSEIKSSEERKTFQVMMDVGHFLRKELYVKIIGNFLVVHGEHEAVFDEHGRVSRKFTRKFEIPGDVDCETFRAILDCYRVLTIEASFKRMGEKGEEFEVPIRVEADIPECFTSFHSLENFEEKVKHHLKDAQFMRDFARKLAEQDPSDYIPMEEIL